MAKSAKLKAADLPPTVELPYVKALTDLDGLPVLTVKRDEDGKPVWEDEAAKVPEMEPCDTLEMLKVIRRQVPRSILADDDSLRFMELHLALAGRRNGSPSQGKDGDSIVVPGGVASWLVRLLRRPVPVPAEAKAQGMKPQTYACHLWGTDEEHVWRQMGLAAIRDGKYEAKEA